MNWKISKGNEICVQCEGPLLDGKVFFSVIDTEEAEICRLDYCAACFESDPENKKKVFWRTRKVSAQKPMKKAVNFEVVRDIFLKMLEVNEKEFKEVAYLLGLVLIRKRFFRLKDFVSVSGIDYMEIRQKKDAPLIRVEVPLLKEEDIVILRNKLSNLLDADFDESVDVAALRESITAPCEEPGEEELAAAPDEAEASAESEADPSTEAPSAEKGLPDDGQKAQDMPQA